MGILTPAEIEAFPSQEGPREGEEVMAAREKEKLVGRKPRIIEERSTPVKPQRASKKDKGKAVLIEEVLMRQNEVPLEGIRMKVSPERAAEVLTMSSHIEEDLVASEEVVAKAVKDEAAAKSGPQKVLPLL
ncbi:hypothetical protein AXG93_1675s1010 [Marchantia polymorpha subsp. ruderalis]|uniref:Uncharacterized protein n=1 Tax=Marchantia polymorpha subsp. ruderalis TaxID=1480154 RepID=A0A176VK58_MARPO|nr:hypothetical protein AXG93_1675s1010 [Marchantia polymorpha subsp. ruderalis]